MEVRDATPEDAPAIRRVHEASIRGLGPDAYDDRQVDAWAAGCATADYAGRIADAGEFVVAVDDRRGGSLDDVVVGFGSLVYEADAYPFDADAEVTGIYVVPSVAETGVGTALLEELEARAANRDATRLALTASRNAVGFYERHGYARRRSLEHEFSAHESTGVTGTVVEMANSIAGSD